MAQIEIVADKPEDHDARLRTLQRYAGALACSWVVAVAASLAGSLLYYPFLAVTEHHKTMLWLAHGAFLATGLLGIGLGFLGLHGRTARQLRADGLILKALNELDQIFNATGTGMRVIDLERRIIRTNQAYAAIAGATLDEIAGQTCCRSLSCRDNGTEACCLSRIAGGAGELCCEIEAPAPDGKKKHYLVTSSPFQDRTGRLVGIVQSFIDITARKQAEDELAAQKNRYAGILANAPIGIFHSRADDTFVYINPAMAEVFGYGSAEQMLEEANRHGVSELLCLQRESCVELLRKTEAAAGWHSFEKTFRRRGGSSFLALLVIRAVKDTSGAPSYYEGFIKDITERKKAEDDLRRARDEWARTFESIGDVLTIQDRDMRIVQVNRKTCETLQMKEEEIIGKYCYEIFTDNNLPCPGCPIVDAKRDFIGHTAEIFHPKLGRTFMVGASPLVDEQGEFTGAIHIARDISAMKNLEKQAQHAQKLEAVGILSGGVAHDFNNILTGISGYSELLLREIKNDDTHLRQDVTEVRDLAKRGAHLTRQLLAFSRKQAIEPVALNCNDIIRNLTRMLRRLIGEDIELEERLAEDLALIDADPGQLEQVLVNLAVNARDAMPSGGRLTISTENVRLDQEYTAQHPEVKPGDHVMLLVADTGSGIDAETMEHIFEPFFTTKEVGKGTGLGLATVYGIVKQHRGSIWVYSEPGKGTTFKIYFPAPPLKAAAVAEESRSEDLSGTGTILLVEDEPTVRDITHRILEKLGYTVLVAEEPEKAAAIFAAHQHEIDLLLTDVIMPQRNGKALFEELRRLKPDLKVLYMSGYTAEIVTRQGLVPAGTHFISKPFTLEKISLKIRDILDRT